MQQSGRKYVDLLDTGAMYKRVGNYEEAQKLYEEAIHIDHTNPIAYFNLGKLFNILKDYEASARAYKVAYDLKYNDETVLLIHLGHTLLDEKNEREWEYREIVAYYRQSIDPYSKINGRKVLSPSAGKLSKYNKKCLAAAKKFIDTFEV
ncbi:tetratricopeptide repeat protein [Bacillus paramobilis]|uniref:Tetratricopeptide repeat protein n=1 Tax=Bacillus paramobilis TaxID=2817477 RepID=A0ABZ2VKI3_9BACI